jgi:hypothetical protein
MSEANSVPRYHLWAVDNNAMCRLVSSCSRQLKHCTLPNMAIPFATGLLLIGVLWVDTLQKSTIAEQIAARSQPAAETLTPLFAFSIALASCAIGIATAYLISKQWLPDVQAAPNVPNPTITAALRKP